MSYDLVVWEGPRPDSDDEACEVFADLAERYLEGDPVSGTAAITRFTEALVRRWGDLDHDAESPWATGGTGDTNGPILTVNIRHSDDRLEEVANHVAELAAQHSLVCYDPQQDRLRP
ncbi:hypothetical protein [Amycolatopsis sp. CA-230715]|uniref:hypothetical protein n=1 Tax=Amycolatopsis sp. CA-230715 TaxID=2745196 RepID=UPI001C022E71|nr:hypothetical protein [Amycolatopsis sp. CA-230715]QWF85601.1 hypothetical protein HUW46_09056 [Amycolatopsis sp. CA-230715]